MLVGTIVVFQNHPVRAILCLVLTFFGSAVLWLMLQAEFLSLILLLVYVGAVMTLFLFVVMMLEVDVEAMRSHLWRLFPVGIFIAGGMLLFFLQNSQGFSAFLQSPIEATEASSGFLSNTQQIGQVLYTEYLYPFELAAVILLIAMVAAISLVHRHRVRSKRQVIRQQLMTHPAQRLRMVAGGKREKEKTS